MMKLARLTELTSSMFQKILAGRLSRTKGKRWLAGVNGSDTTAILHIWGMVVLQCEDASKFIYYCAREKEQDLTMTDGHMHIHPS